MINFYGYSWAIVACWAVVAFMIVRHLPALSVPRWKLMFLITSISIVVIGIVSTIRPESWPLLRPEADGYLQVILGNASLPVVLFRTFCIVAICALFVSKAIRTKAEEAVFAAVLFGFTSTPPFIHFLLSRGKRSIGNCYRYLFQLFGKISLTASSWTNLNTATDHLLAKAKDQTTGGNKTNKVEAKCVPDTAQPICITSSITSTQRSSESRTRYVDPLAVPGDLLWTCPPPNVLEISEPAASAAETFVETGHTIKDALTSHGVDVEIADVIEGPNTIQFGLSPGWVNDHKSAQRQIMDDTTSNQERVKVDSILARKKDLSMVLKTVDLAMHAPIPGKSWVGLEIPKPFRTTVTLGDVIHTREFKECQDITGLPLALGLDTRNQPVWIDLTRAPHLLVAGESGSGKSAGINSMVCSLLMTRSPKDLRLILLDPKRVELARFQGIPHLDSEIVVDANEASAALSRLIDNLFTRLETLRVIGVRNIQEYNQIPDCHMPFIVVVIDELADLILQSKHLIEDPLVRIAQLGRAAGVHLVLATQRPSSDVITGLLKANLPSRIAFSMSSAVDSRVLLGRGGAEVLLGKGDMLLSDNGSQTFQRIQGGMVKDHEITEIVKHWTMQSENTAQNSIKATDLIGAA